MKRSLTIITPTYNRKELLVRCFESLKKQTSFDFEWIIVDDGSTDGTKDVVDTFVTTQFPIHYFFKENGGKHTALNFAHPHINGQYVTILDSDDYFCDDAVERIIAGWETVTDDSVGLVIFLKGKKDQDGKVTPLCTAAQEGQIVDVTKAIRIKNISNDCAEVIRTDLFLQYPFPEFQGERFVAEGALWERIGQTHRCVYFNQVVCICEYLASGLTGAGRKMRFQNPNGGLFTSNLRMDSNHSFTQRIKNGLLYVCYGCFAKKSVCTLARECCCKWLLWCCLLPGWLLHLYWRKKYDLRG